MLTFDDNGYLVPDKPIIIDFETFVREFVVNDHRAEIYSEYKNLLQGITELSLGSFYQWIDGSYISQKTKPNDIDVVTFIDFEEYDQQEKKLRQLRQQYEKVDSYFVRNYPENHPRRFITEFDKTEWLHLFSTDRRKNKKGFIQLIFE